MAIARVRQTGLEKGAIVVAVAAYLIILHRTFPHSDALRIVRQIEQAHLEWNPNHLLFDPFGYVVYALFSRLGVEISMLGCFSVISGIATVLSLLIFHSVLIRAGVVLPSIRLVATASLWASHAYLSQAVSQYYFMLQMPFLMAVLYLYFDFINRLRAGVVFHRHLYWMGLLLAVSATIMFNNLLVVIAAGLGVGLVGKSWREWRIGFSLRVWLASAALGLPVFIGGYLFSGHDSGFLAWLLSYGGNPASKLNEFYGIKWTLSGVVDAAAMVGFNAVLGSLVTTAGLGTILRVMVSGYTYEFNPSLSAIVPNMLLAPAVILLCVASGYHVIRYVSREASTRFLALWVGSYLVFNFLWNVSDDIFWIQGLPGAWLIVLQSLGFISVVATTSHAGVASPHYRHWRWYALVVLAPMLLVVNTRAVVLPVSGSGFQLKQAQHERLLRDDDLEIVPGWDEHKWLILSDSAPSVQRFALMNAALEQEASPKYIQRLDEIVASHLRGGGRVVVARLYDLDQDLLPWYALQKLGWPRRRIQDLLGSYCNRPLADIGGVKFREVYVCTALKVPERPGGTAAGDSGMKE